MRQSVRWLDITVHILAWGIPLLLINVGHYQWQFARTEDGTMLGFSLYGSAFNALVFYGHALWLHPRKKKYAQNRGYWLVVIALLVIISLAEGAIDYFYFESLNLLPNEIEGQPVSSRLVWVWIFSVPDGIIHVIYWLLSFAYVQFLQLKKFRHERTELAQQKLTTELQYLRAQVNPHVLFNGINSVYHLIDEQPERAKHTLLTFSNLLRYQLYECQADQVPLDQELAHLADYITLEETRKGDDAVIVWEVQDHDPERQIAPMLLQPFVENAFKHLSHHEEAKQNRLEISLAIDQGVLSLKVENTVSPPTATAPTTEGGVGLTNVQRRLQLIYPDRHQLFMSRPTGWFHVHLIITL